MGAAKKKAIVMTEIETGSTTNFELVTVINKEISPATISGDCALAKVERRKRRLK